MSNVTVLILNTNRKVDTLRCISSIVNQKFGLHRVDVLVIDNGSTDGSVDEINRVFPDVKVIQTEVDKGYAGNNNFGFFVGSVQTEYTMILNEDTYFMDNSIATLIDYMIAHNDVGICGPLVVNESNEKSVQSNGGWLDSMCVSRFHDHCSDVESISREPHIVDWVSGCAFVVRTDLFRMLNGFWEPFYYTWEEVDLCKRVTASGFHCCVVPSARIVHRDCPSNPSDNAMYYALRNRLLFVRRNCNYGLYCVLLFRAIAGATKQYIMKMSPRPYVRQAIFDIFLFKLGKRRV
jgi:GT2 family glycosyltransferase